MQHPHAARAALVPTTSRRGECELAVCSPSLRLGRQTLPALRRGGFRSGIAVLTPACLPSCSSHSILCFALRTNTEPAKTVGKLSFIDLAGSERGAGMGSRARMHGFACPRQTVPSVFGSSS